MENYKKLIGKKIQKRRKEVGFPTQQSFADSLEVDQSRVARWESGHNFPDADSRDSIAKKLKVGLEFFDVTDAPPNPSDSASKSKLIVDIVAILPSLDENQLGQVLALARGHAAGSGSNEDSEVI